MTLVYERLQVQLLQRPQLQYKCLQTFMVKLIELRFLLLTQQTPLMRL